MLACPNVKLIDGVYLWAMFYAYENITPRSELQD